ncbi:exonuclease SbcCD subunit D C-terminal domain-containing protein [Colwellia sp. MSW7]|uniref:Exonuclease SbcCD subunit D C-terminal domain-containing protein n=1 Tax=Colwellia maritima TaxID=2912588 RepID=A0ABS9X287_9GAMM|nr:exonuclease SbcCD subunit D C-terminal domain-containing protein [Colwellia maritima]MCI2284305.1 exonuclease SbcCD subunit D C-terminal domain-containing protein [Colwellia maritima]
MLKTTLDNLHQDIETLIPVLLTEENKTDNEVKLWLDIELANTGSLNDLQSKITALVKDFPVEVLLVRRQKQVRQRLLLDQQQDHSNLNELTLAEVFDSRLQQEEALDTNDLDDPLHDEGLKRKTQLQTLFNQTVAQVLSKDEL